MHVLPEQPHRFVAAVLVKLVYYFIYRWVKLERTMATDHENNSNGITRQLSSVKINLQDEAELSSSPKMIRYTSTPRIELLRIFLVKVKVSGTYTDGYACYGLLYAGLG